MTFNAGRSVAKLRAPCLGGHYTWISSTTERAPVLQKLLSSGDNINFLVKPNLLTPILRRFYADQPVSRPKAHTGRAANAGRKARATISANAIKKTAPKASTSKKTSKATSRAKPGTKSKSKPKKRVKAKPKKKVLTGQQKTNKAVKARRARIKSLKEKALLDQPKASAVSAYQAYIVEHFKGKNKDTKPTSFLKELAAKWKTVTPEQLEHFNHVANQTTATKKLASIRWIEAHTPEQILEANNARKLLTKLQKVDKPKATPYTSIKDDRLVRRPRGAYLVFYQGRHQSGDFKGLKVSESASLAGREWRALSAAEKKPFQDAFSQDKQRYEEEKKTVYKK